jgi:CheY-like chemotaxis protein
MRSVATNSSTQGRVLVVDDDAGMRKMYQRSLGRAGFDVVVADDAPAGLQRLREDREIRLVLLDLHMPGVDGWKFREAQRSDPDMRDVPTVIVTGAPIADLVSQELHATEYLIKPVGSDHLVRVVSDYCEPAVSGW